MLCSVAVEGIDRALHALQTQRIRVAIHSGGRRHARQSRTRLPGKVKVLRQGGPVRREGLHVAHGDPSIELALHARASR